MFSRFHSMEPRRARRGARIFRSTSRGYASTSNKDSKTRTKPSRNPSSTRSPASKYANHHVDCVANVAFVRRVTETEAHGGRGAFLSMHREDDGGRLRGARAASASTRDRDSGEVERRGELDATKTPERQIGHVGRSRRFLRVDGPMLFQGRLEKACESRQRFVSTHAIVGRPFDCRFEAGRERRVERSRPEPALLGTSAKDRR